MDFLSFIEQTNRCTSPEELERIFRTALSSFGVDGFMYSLVRGSFVKNNKIVHGVVHSYPEDWIKYYSENGYVDDDPTYRQIMKEKGIFTWENLSEKLPFSGREKRVMAEANEAGLKRGISLSLHGPYGEVLGFGFISKTEEEALSKDHLSMMYAMANQFHLVFSALTNEPEDQPGRIRLTDRQRSVLEWAAQGKSRSDIAGILGVTVDTIDDHYRKIYNKLGCRERIFAVLKAMRLGLIKV